MVDSESIVQIATSIAKRMGLNVSEFEQELRLSVLEFKPLNNKLSRGDVKNSERSDYVKNSERSDYVKNSERDGDVKSCVCVFTCEGTCKKLSCKHENSKKVVYSNNLPNYVNTNVDDVQTYPDKKHEKNIQTQCTCTVGSDHESCDVPQQRTYTLEFLRELMKSDEFKTVPKIGMEAPRSNSSPTPYHHTPKGKYKPHIITDIDRTKSANVKNVGDNAGEYYVKQGLGGSESHLSRDIVRSTNTTPPPTPPRGENAWVPPKVKKEAEDDPIKLKFNKIRSDLNKISPDNELPIANRVCEELIEECIADIIPVFFDKGVWEQKYREIYVRLCVKLNAKFPGVFLSALLEHTQHEFEKKVPEDAEDDEIVYAMKRRIGAAYFIVEMLKVKLLKPVIVVSCAEKMLGLEKEKSDYDICHVAELVIIAIPIIKNKDAIGKLRALIGILENLHLSQRISQRAKFKIEDAVKVFQK
jgi:hypothetical protein